MDVKDTVPETEEAVALDDASFRPLRLVQAATMVHGIPSRSVCTERRACGKKHFYCWFLTC